MSRSSSAAPPPAPQSTTTADDGSYAAEGAQYAYDPSAAGAAGYDLGYTSYYKADGTFVQVMADGTEFHYPPAEAQGGVEGEEASAPPPAAGAAAAAGGDRKNNPLEEARFYPPSGATAAAAANGDAAAAAGGVAVEVTERVPHDSSKPRTQDEIQFGSPTSMHSSTTSGMWITDLATEVFVSLGFKLYFGALLCASFVIEFFVGFDYMWACLYRVYNPPDPRRDLFWQSLAHMCTFLVLSFTITAMLCTVLDVIRDFWNAKRHDTQIWGLNSKTAPPWLVHVVIVTATTIAPAMWSLIQTTAEVHTGIYFVQHICYSPVIITLWITVALYLWYFCLSLWQKKQAHQLNRLKENDGDDATPQHTEVVGAHGNPIRKHSWYHHQSVLREYGLDSKSLTWMLAVFLAGLVPLLVLSVLIATEGASVSWNFGWTAVAIAFLVIMAILRELTNSKHRANAAIGSILLIIIFVIAALIACGSSGNPNLFGTFLITAGLCQFFLLRKRPYTLGDSEVVELFGPAVDEVSDPMDSYLCCCRNTLYTLFRPCFDVRGTFGVKAPAVRQAEKDRRQRRMSLWSDQKILMYYWILFWITLIFVLTYSRQMAIIFSDRIAATGGSFPADLSGFDVPDWYAKETTSSSLCTTVFNPRAVDQLGTVASLKLYELALLRALGYSYGDNFIADFFTWFPSATAGLVPTGILPSNAAQAVGNDGEVSWIDFYNPDSNFHYVVVRGIDKGVTWMRNVDVWGDSLVFQASSVLAPMLSFWPTKQKQEFVHGVSFFKRVSGGAIPFGNLENYVKNFTNPAGGKNSSHRFLFLGHGANGGIARIVGGRLNWPAVAFSGPGITLLAKKYDLPPNNMLLSLNIKATNDAASLVDDNSRDGGQLMIPCREGTLTEHLCDHIANVARSIKKLCGDRLGRYIVGNQ